MPTRIAIVKNKNGIHCRPSSCILMTAGGFHGCSFGIKTARGGSDLGSILSLTALNIEYGEEVSITVEGPNAEKACDELVAAFEREFNY